MSDIILKIWVTKANTKKVQEALGRLGWFWHSEAEYYHWCTNRWIICFDDKHIAHGISDDAYKSVPEYKVKEEYDNG